MALPHPDCCSCRAPSSLQAELAAAHVQIHRSEGRLRDSVANLTELENSVRRSFGPGAWTDGPAVAAAEPAAAAAPQATAATAEVAAPAAAPLAPEAAQQQRRRPAVAPPAQRAAQPRGGGRAGLSSRGKPGLAIPEQLKDFWFPVEFSASLVEGRMVPFELFGDVSWGRLLGAGCCLARGLQHVGAPASAGGLLAVCTWPAHGAHPRCWRNGPCSSAASAAVRTLLARCQPLRSVSATCADVGAVPG